MDPQIFIAARSELQLLEHNARTASRRSLRDPREHYLASPGTAHLVDFVRQACWWMTAALGASSRST
jgi:hypothetical protein